MCIWRMPDAMSVVVMVWGSVGMLVVYRGLLKNVCFMSRDVVRCVSSYKCCMLESCVHPVAVHNDAFCMTCSLLMLVEDATGDHMEEAYSRDGLMTAL